MSPDTQRPRPAAARIPPGLLTFYITYIQLICVYGLPLAPGDVICIFFSRLYCSPCTHKTLKKSLEVMRCNNVVYSGGVFDTNQKCYIPLEPQEDRIRDYVNLIFRSHDNRNGSEGQRVEERVFHPNLLKTSDCQQRNLMISVMIKA